MPFLKVPKLTREVIPNDALKALLSAPPDTKIGRRDKLILILLYDSAVRVSELLSMNVSSVNLEVSIPYLRFKINNVIFIFFLQGKLAYILIFRKDEDKNTMRISHRRYRLRQHLRYLLA